MTASTELTRDCLDLPVRVKKKIGEKREGEECYYRHTEQENMRGQRGTLRALVVIFYRH